MRGMLTGLLMACLVACAQEAPPTGVQREPTLGENWLLINYWATWCAPCRKEIPELNQLARSAPGLTVYAVNFDGVTGEELIAQAADLGIEFTLLSEDPGPALGITQPRVLPTTLLVDPQGAVVATLIGPQTEAGLKEELALARKTRAQQ